MTIDAKLLPQTALFDTSVLVPSLRRDSPADDAPAELFDAMLAARRTILIAAPSIAELLRRGPTTELPRTKNVRVVAFDLICAEVLAKHFPPVVVKGVRDDGGGPLSYYKYDALIVATAVRYRADMLVSEDEAQRKLAAKAGLAAKRVADFAGGQLPLIPP